MLHCFVDVVTETANAVLFPFVAQVIVLFFLVLPHRSHRHHQPHRLFGCARLDDWTQIFRVVHTVSADRALAFHHAHLQLDPDSATARFAKATEDGCQ